MNLNQYKSMVDAITYDQWRQYEIIKENAYCDENITDEEFREIRKYIALCKSNVWLNAMPTLCVEFDRLITSISLEVTRENDKS